MFSLQYERLNLEGMDNQEIKHILPWPRRRCKMVSEYDIYVFTVDCVVCVQILNPFMIYY